LEENGKSYGGAGLLGGKTQSQERYCRQFPDTFISDSIGKSHERVVKGVGGDEDSRQKYLIRLIRETHGVKGMRAKTVKLIMSLGWQGNQEKAGLNRKRPGRGAVVGEKCQ